MTSLKPALLLSALASVGIAGSTNAAWIAYHDIGGAQSGPNITNAYVNASNAFTSNPADSTVGLVSYADGSATGASITVAGDILNHDHRTGIVSAPAAATPADALFNVAGLDLTQGTINFQGTGVVTFTVTGLDSNLLYDIAFYGDRGAGADGAETFTLSGVDSSVNSSSTGIVNALVTNQETRSNATPGNVVRYSSIDAGDDGTFVVTVTANSGVNIGHINAIRLEEVVPEPGSLALLGLGGLCLLKRRRRG